MGKRNEVNGRGKKWEHNITRKYGNRKDKEGKEDIRDSDGRRAEQRVRDTGRVQKETSQHLQLDKSMSLYMHLHFKPDISVSELGASFFYRC